MKFKTEIINGIIIFVGMGLYFLLMEWLNMSHHVYLRLLNLIFVVYGVNRAIKTNYEAGVRGYFANLIGAIITSMIGAVLSIIALWIYIQANGGEAYLNEHPARYIFGGDTTNVEYFCIALLFEASAASLAVSFCLMQYWKDKVEVINKVD
ncbi:MAG: hypothetical protein EOO51_14690 [Flavobacterium sp.]|nr:MAG: hypothetical protein EOO51_14690 [Flavobacterium sp.]